MSKFENAKTKQNNNKIKILSLGMQKVATDYRRLSDYTEADDKKFLDSCLDSYRAIKNILEKETDLKKKEKLLSVCKEYEEMFAKRIHIETAEEADEINKSRKKFKNIKCYPVTQIPEIYVCKDYIKHLLDKILASARYSHSLVSKLLKYKNYHLEQEKIRRRIENNHILKIISIILKRTTQNYKIRKLKELINNYLNFFIELKSEFDDLFLLQLKTLFNPAYQTYDDLLEAIQKDNLTEYDKVEYAVFIRLYHHYNSDLKRLLAETYISEETSNLSRKLFYGFTPSYNEINYRHNEISLNNVLKRLIEIYNLNLTVLNEELSNYFTPKPFLNNPSKKVVFVIPAADYYFLDFFYCGTGIDKPTSMSDENLSKKKIEIYEGLVDGLEQIEEDTENILKSVYGTIDIDKFIKEYEDVFIKAKYNSIETTELIKNSAKYNLSEDLNCIKNLIHNIELKEKISELVELFKIDKEKIENLKDRKTKTYYETLNLKHEIEFDDSIMSKEEFGFLIIRIFEIYCKNKDWENMRWAKEFASFFRCFDYNKTTQTIESSIKTAKSKYMNNKYVAADFFEREKEFFER